MSSQLQNVKDIDSLFYQSYPSHSSTYSDSTRQGFFENLDLYYGLAFSRSNRDIQNLVSTGKPNSILTWPINFTRKMINWKLQGAGKDDMVERQLHIASYLFEFVYDLCLSPRENISQAPGFESIIGYRGISE